MKKTWKRDGYAALVTGTLILAACGTTAKSGGSAATVDAVSGTDAQMDGGTDAATVGADTATADAAPDTASAGDTQLNGTLGKLGAVQATVSSLFISNSGETLIYLSSAPLTCATLKVSHWLTSGKAGSQVVEIVIKGDPVVATVDVPDGEINYAAGGKSSAYEVNADSGSIVFTKAVTKKSVEGTLSAQYGSDTISGTFSATFCDGGQGY